MSLFPLDKEDGVIPLRNLMLPNKMLHFQPRNLKFEFVKGTFSQIQILLNSKDSRLLNEKFSTSRIRAR